MNTLYADIIVDISHEKLDRTFQYRVPESLRGRLEPGACVMIPFGNGNRLIKGYVVAFGETCQFAPEKIKDIAGMPEKETGVEDKMIVLAAWIRRNYGCTMIQALKTVLPAKQSVKKLEHRQLVRLMNREEILSLLGECERKRQVAKARLLKALSEQETIPYEWITGKLGVSAATVNSIVKSGAAKLVSSESYRNPVKMQSVEAVRNTLSEEQQTIVTEVLADFDAGRRQTYLIHGITGSGKTEVYMQLIEEMIARGRQAIVLIPEIALTYQTLLRFYQRFGDRVSVMNSTLSPGEKYDQCERAKAGEIDVIIGPRSALFTPFPNLGLIVMDEEQENSYKSESTPKYHARETALEVAKLYGASVVLGSATPSLEAYYRAGKGEYRLFQLTKRLTGGELPAMVMIDCISRLVPGVLGNGDSAEIESFYDNLLEYPQYTRPEVYEGKTVPEVLLSGHHKNIESWRREQSIRRTLERRPDLLEDASLTLKEQKFLDSLLKEQGESQLKELEQLVREAVKSDETPGSDREYYQQMKKVKKLLNEKKATLQELKGYYKVLGALKQEI